MFYKDLKLLAAGFCLGWIACSSLTLYAVANSEWITRGGKIFDTDYKVVS